MNFIKTDKITIDMTDGTVTVQGSGKTQTHSFSDPEAFSVISDIWLRAGWDVKYAYSFSWLGRPIIQLPEDMFRVQEVIYRVKPDVIVETGIAHGGSLVFYASLLKALGRGRVIGIDIEIRKHNRQALEAHELASSITLIESSSIEDSTIQEVASLIEPGERVLVILDSCHTKDHVLQELRQYAPLVSVGSYIVATDGIMEEFADAPRSQPDWSWNNPKSAVREFLPEDSRFILEEPQFTFNEGSIDRKITYWPNAYLRRIK